MLGTDRGVVAPGRDRMSQLAVSGGPGRRVAVRTWRDPVRARGAPEAGPRGSGLAGSAGTAWRARVAEAPGQASAGAGVGRRIRGEGRRRVAVGRRAASADGAGPG